MISYKFKCPSCKHTIVEELVGNVLQVSNIIRVVADDSETEVEEIVYGKSETEDGVVIRYQCRKCGWVIRLPEAEGAIVKTQEKLLEWMKQHGTKQESRVPEVQGH